MTVTVKRIAAAECLPRRLAYEVPEGVSVRELIDLLAGEYGGEVRTDLLEDGEIADGALIMLNGVSLMQPDVSLDSVLRDGDELFFSTMVYGG